MSNLELARLLEFNLEK